MIVGLGERKRYDRIGKIRIGEKDERGYPRSLDYFRLVPESGFEKIIEQIKETYGEKPKSLTVYLPGEPDLDEVWSPWYRRYTRNGLACKGDGVTGREIQRDGTAKEIPCAQRGCPYAKPDEKGKAACKPTGILSLKIYGVDHPGVFHMTLGGMIQVEMAHTFLMGMKEDKGEVAGWPFTINTERKKSPKGVFTRVVFHHEPNNLGRIETNEKPKGVEGIAIVDEGTGEVMTADIPAESGPAQALATMINEAIKDGLLVGQAKIRALQNLTRTASMTEKEVEELMDKMADYLTELENTWDDPVSQHKGDVPLAEAVFKRLDETARAERGIKVTNPEELTRGQVRDLMKTMGL